MRIFFLLGFTLLAASVAGATLLPENANVKHVVLPFQVTNGTSTAETWSVNGGLDLPKMTPGVNDSTFDWYGP